MTMKQSFHVFLIFFLLLSHLISARSLAQKQGEEEVKLHTTTFKEVTEDLMKLMGSEREGCDEKDEECLKRRMIAEAHLDYIYTQHNKP
ncbi:putative phytosulfokines 6 isoform X1 [Pistacia vera]|uniref:Uncharacterized protein n=1 Tax=Pistacia atlantica TaxID=434234 RepID=A0ACC1ANP4_9ROSI|nr:putative phytosulfokines 6 isoform X1 [Pistacia vera]KAJ0088258.1 hypothetical protein Patl1_32379 [Pistacia atlantica]